MCNSIKRLPTVHSNYVLPHLIPLQMYAMNQSLDNTIREIGNQLNGSFTILVTQLQLGVVRNLSWSEGNITVNLTKHYQTQLENMSRTHHGIIQHQQAMLNKVLI